jgi:hypothetical protein
MRLMLLRRVIARLEEPRISGDARIAARVLHIVHRRERVRTQIVHRPQFERMHACDIPTIVEIELVDGVFDVELRQILVRDRRGGRAAQRFAHAGIEPCLRLIGRDASQHRREFRRRLAHVAQQERERLFRRPEPVSPVEAAHVDAALGVGETRQVRMTHRRIVEPVRRRPRHLHHLVMDDIAHQAHEHEIHRMPERALHGEHAGVVRRLEIGEGLRAATSVEGLAGARGVLARDGGIEHRGERAVRRLREIVERPARQDILAVGRHTAQLRCAHRAIARVQRRDDLQVSDDRAHLGRRAQVKAPAAADVEGFVDAVRLHAHEVRAAFALHQREAVRDLRRIVVGPQHVIAE